MDREPPDGFVDAYVSELWQVGHVFSWSQFYECWLNREYRISVKPGETGREAYERETGESYFTNDDFVFYTGLKSSRLA
jgi:hypothetical protein